MSSTTMHNAKRAIVDTNRAAATKSAGLVKQFRGPDWGYQHRIAWNIPSGPETAVVGLADALADYADQHAARHKAPLGEDGVLGAAWLEMLKGWRSLLNGELGRLDGGTCDRIYSAIGRAAGFSDADLEA